MKLFQVIMLVAVLILVILGLNVSNQGVNDFTRDKQGAILALERGENSIVVEVLGNSYACNQDRLGQFKHQINDQSRRMYREIRAYPGYYRRILNAVARKGLDKDPADY